ncbi:spermatogenesis associated 6-like protein [Drosophila tropicalis]|uniref:spermatogenesis associated 6-like protein n=1 Tax=Drosophila tropicalis TaxID=46794 RepID=UPI0035AB952E
MSYKRFYLRLELQLHALTCPGVWLCSHGYLEATVKTLGYYFRTGAMEPRFPMLCHDQFTMEGYFKGVSSMEDMQELLRSERLEITLWQNGRRLAYFVGRLSDVMHPTFPRLTCEHSANVQLLMKATPAFPGILAPKVELSAQMSTQKGTCPSCSPMRERIEIERPAANRHVQSQCFSQLELPARKQQTVCHAKRSNCSLGCSYSPLTATRKSCSNSQSEAITTTSKRRLSTCSGSTQLSSLSEISSTSCSSSPSTNCTHASFSLWEADDHQSSCDICQAYRRMFLH